jgi:hypothetical protein
VPLNFDYNSKKKNFVKIQKYPFTAGLIFLIREVFWSFYYAIKIEKYLIIFDQFENTQVLKGL